MHQHKRIKPQHKKVLGILLIAGALAGIGKIYLPYAFSAVTTELPDVTLHAPITLPSPGNTLVITEPASSPPLETQPRLIIPKLAVNVPVVLNVDATRQYNYNTALKNGVAHMKNTSLLEEEKGNSFIFGHSNRFTPSGSPYDTVFAHLHTLEPNDTFDLTQNGRRYSYTVTESRWVSPNDTSVLAQSDKRIVTLMTCWPPGTTLKRWIVVAAPTPSNTAQLRQL